MCEGKRKRDQQNILLPKIKGFEFSGIPRTVTPKGKYTEHRMHRRVLSIALDDERVIVVIRTRLSLAITVVM